MKKLFYVLTFCFLATGLKAQDIPTEILKSDIFKDEYKNSKIVLVEEDGNGGVVIVRSFSGGIFSRGYGYYFEHYDSSMKLIKDFEYEMKYSEAVKQSSVLGLIMNGDEIHIIDFLYNKDEKAFLCSSNTANINDFVFAKKELFKLKSEEVKQFSFFSRNSSFDNDSGASMIVNEDKTAFAVTVDIQNNKTETHKLYLFDNGLNKKIDHTFKRDVKDRKFRYENIDVSKDGNTLYLLGKVYTEEKKKKKEGGEYQFELSRITKDAIITQAFDTEEFFSQSLKTIIFDDKISCVGFYSEKNDLKFKGISYFELDPNTLSIRTKKYNPFTEQFMIDKYGKDKQKELKNLSFRKIIITANKDIIFNAEEEYIVSYYVNSTNGGYWTYRHYFDDIVSAKLDYSGNLVWARNINKRQLLNDDQGFISYSCTAKGDDIYFFINTADKVKKIRKDRIQFKQVSKNKSNLNVIRINEKGDFDFKEILDDKENEVPFMVSNGAPTNNSIYFIGRKGKKKQLLKVTL